MSLFTIYIVDDEELIHNSLRAYIRRNFPDVEIVPFFFCSYVYTLFKETYCREQFGYFRSSF